MTRARPDTHDGLTPYERTAIEFFDARQEFLASTTRVKGFLTREEIVALFHVALALPAGKR